MAAITNFLFHTTFGIIVLVFVAVVILALLGILLEKRTRKVFPEHEAPDFENDDSIWSFGRLTPDSVYDTPQLIKYREKQAAKAEKEKQKQEERRRRYKELKAKQAARDAKKNANNAQAAQVHAANAAAASTNAAAANAALQPSNLVAGDAAPVVAPVVNAEITQDAEVTCAPALDAPTAAAEN